MSTVNVNGQYGNIVTSESGLEVINNNVTIKLDHNHINDLSI